jgi:hypothetical protein
VQLGFNTAKKCGLPAPICVEFRPEGYSDSSYQPKYDKDQKYLLIIGASHISILKYLLSENPYFEVIEVGSILDGSKTKRR